jgi:glycerol-3-phosphate dehydrogenase
MANANDNQRANVLRCVPIPSEHYAQHKVALLAALDDIGIRLEPGALRARGMLSALTQLAPVASLPPVWGGCAGLVHHGYVIEKSKPGNVYLVGGTFANARRIASQMIDEAWSTIKEHGHRTGPPPPCGTATVGLVGAKEPRVESGASESIRHFIREEFALSVVDVIARRTTAAFENPMATIDAIPAIAEVMAEELHWSAKKRTEEEALARDFMRRVVVPME